MRRPGRPDGGFAGGRRGWGEQSGRPASGGAERSRDAGSRQDRPSSAPRSGFVGERGPRQDSPSRPQQRDRDGQARRDQGGPRQERGYDRASRESQDGRRPQRTDDGQALRHRPIRKPSGQDPQIPDGISAGQLDKAVRNELSGLSREVAVQTGAHLAAANYFIESDPERAWEHAVAARRRGGRLGVVRETAGLAAYRTGRYADALAELRTARRITGSNEHLPVMADCERGLGRPERALELARGPEGRTLDADGRIELKIVESGARADLGEFDAAVVVLQIPELESNRRSPSLARLRFAYSEALKQAKRHQEAETWRDRALAEDPDGSAGVNESLDDELELIDLEWDEDEDEQPGLDSGSTDTVAGQDDDHDDDLDDGDLDEEENGLAGTAAPGGDRAAVDLDGLGDDELDDPEDLDDEEIDDQDLDDDLDEDDNDLDEDDELDQDEDDEVLENGRKADSEELELGSATAAEGSAFEMRFEHGGRGAAEPGTDAS